MIAKINKMKRGMSRKGAVGITVGVLLIAAVGFMFLFVKGGLAQSGGSAPIIAPPLNFPSYFIMPQTCTMVDVLGNPISTPLPGSSWNGGAGQYLCIKNDCGNFKACKILKTDANGNVEQGGNFRKCFCRDCND